MYAKCQRCNKPACITIVGIGDFCADCHNAWVEEKYGITEKFEYPGDIMFWDSSADQMRAFHLQHLDFGSCISWEALEQPEGYEVRHVSYPGENPTKVVGDFMEKIISAVSTKTLDSQYTLKEKGNMKVVWSDEGTMALSIDGEVYSTARFGEMIRNHEGFQIQYRFVDPADSVLKENELLMPVKVGYQVLMDELEKAINICSDRGFIDYKHVLVFSEYFYGIYEKLKLMKASSDFSDDAVKTAKDMIKIFSDIETDDDWFPTDIIDMLYRIVGDEY